MNRKPHNLTRIKSYRLTPSLAFHVRVAANSLDLTESAFVRQILLDALERL